MTLNENVGISDGMDQSNVANGSVTRTVDATNEFKEPDDSLLARFPSPWPIAVVGMACRFAGGLTSPEKLWDFCSSGRDAWSQTPETRFNAESVNVPSSEGASRNPTIGGYFLQQDLASFDATFFGLTSEEASAMDPQLRMLLEVVYEATEDAGFPIDMLAGPEPNTSVFVASSNQDYRDLQNRDPETMPASVSTATDPAMLSGRISQFYDFQGMSMSIDAGGPGALAALHEGCQTIRSRQSRVCIIGASNAILNPDLYIRTRMDSPGIVGTNRSSDDWESRWQACNCGEGVAVLILKPLDTALKDGDKVHAVIRNSGLNQNGKPTNIEGPLPAQTRLIRECYRSAGLDISQTAYIEAQMTGAKGWNASEAKSLSEAFAMSRGTDERAWIGAVTTNVGYTGAVGGLAGLIKATMAMKHRSIPPSLNHTVGNAEIDLEGLHLRVPTSLVPWPIGKPLRASINGFGRSGTNAHVILEAAPESITEGKHPREELATPVDDDGSRVYLLSAQSPAALEAMAKNLASHLTQLLQAGEAPSPAVLAHTLSSRRSRLSHITTIRAQSLSSLAQHLSAAKIVHASQPPTTMVIPRIGFVFNGQGAQWHAMGRELLVTYPAFKTAIHYADSILRHEYGSDWSLLEELSRDVETTRVSEMHLGQPVTVALQLCLVVLLRQWGIRPEAVTSHSSGEIAAAYTAGALSFRQALGVAYWQGALARDLLDHKQSGLAGGMAAGGVGIEEAERYTVDTKSGGKVVVACVNSSESVTFAGDVDDLDEVVARLESDGKFGRRIDVPVAYHSHHMLRLAHEYTEKLRAIVPAKPTWSDSVTYTSPVTGGFITTPDQLTAEHYVNNLTNPVLFSQAFEALCFGADRNSSAGQVDAIVEIGPHSTLNGPIRQILGGRAMTYVSCLKRNSDSVSTMQDLAATLVQLRYPVDLDAVNRCTGPAERRPFIYDLPPYPWDHDNSYWAEPRISREIRFRRDAPHEILGTSVAGATTPSWRNFLRLVDLPWVGDHRVNGKAVLPAAAYVCMAIEAVKKLASRGPEAGRIKRYTLRNVEFLHVLTVPETGEGVETHLNLRAKRDQLGWYEFDVRSLGANGAWVENCCGMVAGLQEHGETTAPNVDVFLDNTARHMDKTALQSQIAAKTGVDYGPAFQGLSNGRVSVTTNRAVADLRIRGLDIDSGATSYVVHPTMLDCAIQAACVCLPRNTGKKSFVVPRSLRGIAVCDRSPAETANDTVVLGELYKLGRRGFTSRVCVVSNSLPSHGQVKLTLEGLFCQAIPRPSPPSPSGVKILLSTTRWEPDVLHSIPKVIRDTMCINLSERELDLERKLDRASYHLIADAVSVLENQSPALNPHTWTPRQCAMFDWMKTIVAKGRSGHLAAGSTGWAKATEGVKRMLYDDLKFGAGAYGDLLVRIGSALAVIVNGDMTAEDLLRQYKNGVPLPPRLETRSLKQLSKLVELFAVKNPGARVLEIGTGTGAATLVVLEAFTPRPGRGSLIGDYVATDPDPRALGAAKTKISSLADMVEFRELNIAKGDPVVAGFAEHSFDLVVATMVMQGTGYPEKALRNIRKLLAPTGKLILLEPTLNRLDTQLLCGALVDHDTNGADEPPQTLKLPELDDILRANGFTGAEFGIHDCEQLQYQGSRVTLTSVAVLDRTKLSKHAAGPAISIVVPSSPESTGAWITTLTATIHAETGITVAAEALEDVKPQDENIYILTDLRDSNTGIDTFDQQNLDRIRGLLTMNSGILWLTTDGKTSDAPVPRAALVQGHLATLRQEATGKPCTLLNLPPNWTTNISSVVDHIVEVLKRTLTSECHGPRSVDWEYAVKDSVLKVPRVYPANDNSKEDGTEVETLQPFHTPGRSLVWDVSAERGFVEDSPTKNIPDDMVEIQTVAFSVDSLGGQGHDDETPGLYEVAGFVTKVGKYPMRAGLQIGDNVCALVKGPFASTARAVWTNVGKVPAGISLQDAACIPLAYSSTYYALVHIARLQKDEKVLILHAAGSQEAQAAIAVARTIGANLLFAPATSAESKLLAERYDIPTSQMVRSWGGAIPVIMEKTGVDVVITNRSAHKAGSRVLSPLEDSIGRFGRWVEIGDSRKGSSTDVAALTARCITYSCVDPFQLAEHNGQVMREVLGACLDIIGHGGFSTPPNLRQFPVSDLDRALELVYQQRQSGGGSKFIIVPQADERVKVRRGARPYSLDDENSTYLIVGAALCTHISSWMASEGAKNVVVVSSNAEAHPEAVALTEDAAAQGCRLRFANCNVSDEEGLLAFLSQLSASFPPIRGVVHVGPNPHQESRTTIVESKSYVQWQRFVGERIAGVANLHKLLPENLSFFVLFHLGTGVEGDAPQAIDITLSAFEGSLARHRASRGLAATSFVFPVKTALGMLVEEVDAQRPSEAINTKSIYVETLIELLGATIRQEQTHDRRVADAQTIVGLLPWDQLPTKARERRDGRFGTLRLASSPKSSVALPSRATSTDPTTLLLRAINNTRGTNEEVTMVMAEALQAHLEAILNVPVESVDVERAVAAQGVDSMVAVEVRNWLASVISVKLSVSDVLRSPSLKNLAALVVAKGLLVARPNGVASGVREAQVF